jgi:hypothetical protein
LVLYLRNIFVTRILLNHLVAKYGRDTVYNDGVTPNDEACNVVRFKHYLHYHLRKFDGKK